VMAPAQLIEPKDLPPEVLVGSGAEMPMSVTPAALGNHTFAGAEREMAGEGALPSTSGGALPMGAPAGLAPMGASPVASASWESGLEQEAQALLAAGRHDVWDALSRRFESRLILTALANTRGRRIEAAQNPGLGRNTITRKIAELHLDRDATD